MSNAQDMTLDGYPIDTEGLHMPTVQRITARLRQIRAPWCASIIDSEARRDAMPELEEDRAQEVAKLRALADFIEANSDLRNPMGTNVRFYVHFSNYESGEGDVEGKALEDMRAYRRRVGGLWEKVASDDYFELHGTIAGFPTQLFAGRDDVCQRIVVGTKVETTMEYPPDAFTGIEKVPVTKEVEIVDWLCPDSIG